MLVAGRRRVEQKRPGDVAVILGFTFSLAFAAEDGRVDDEVLEQLHAHALVDVVVDAQDELRPVAVRIFQHGLDRLHVLVQLAGDVETVDPVEQLRDIVRGVLLQVLDRLLDRKGPHAVFEIHFGFLLLFSLPIIYLLHGKLNRIERGRRWREKNPGRRSGAVISISAYSHSTVAGGLLVISYTTRDTLRTSFGMRVPAASSTDSGSFVQSALMKSSVVTERSATV